MIARLVRSADFERVLRSRSRVNTAHFALHHLPVRPGRRREPPQEPPERELSTGQGPMVERPVDDVGSAALIDTVWLGAVVPKRHARRAVTRTLLKRQIRAAVGRRAEVLAGGLWVVRLRAPFDRTEFISAASAPLARSARAELDQLIERALRQAPARA